MADNVASDAGSPFAGCTSCGADHCTVGVFVGWVLKGNGRDLPPTKVRAGDVDDGYVGDAVPHHLPDDGTTNAS